jgi:hypothetical protein
VNVSLSAEKKGQIVFSVDQRVQLHPFTDRWLMGDKYGTIVKIGRKYVHVRMDWSNQTIRVSEHYLLEVVES